MTLKPNATAKIKRGECESAAYRGVGKKCHPEKAVDEQKPNWLGWTRSKRQQRKIPTLKGSVRTLLDFARGIAESNERNEVQ